MIVVTPVRDSRFWYKILSQTLFHLSQDVYRFRSRYACYWDSSSIPAWFSSTASNAVIRKEWYTKISLSHQRSANRRPNDSLLRHPTGLSQRPDRRNVRHLQVAAYGVSNQVERARRWSAHETRCNLMSWTSSLLFALQYGLYRHQTDCDEVGLLQVLLFVLDTRDFQEGHSLKTWRL